MAFTFAYKFSGSAPTLIKLPLAADTVVTPGMMVNLESGYLDEAAAGDTGLVGIATEAGDNTGGDAGDVEVECIIDPDAVYAAVDANARLAGATLDIASGSAGVTTSSQTDFYVVKPCSATQDTLVAIIPASHYLT